jgi:alkanesulfonate monooxygenase SsuD/methylene tetrahydromethanopterin reductase-like flavin-dependent oxidoreductase (luciferase family)
MTPPTPCTGETSSDRFAPFAQIFRRAAKAAGHDPAPPFSINSHGFIADDSDEAAEIAYGPMKLMMDRIGRERGWPPMTREQFEASRGLDGATFVGNPDEVIAKILFQHEVFAHDRFLIQFTIGTIPHEKVLRSIELFGTVVAPAVRKALASRS